MINLQATRILKTDFAPLAAGVHNEDEGQALVSIKENGIRVVRPSTGGEGETFAGLQMSRAVPARFIPKVEKLVVSKPDGALHAFVRTVRVPVAGRLLIKLGGVVVTTIGADEEAPDTAGQVNRVKDVFYFNDADLKKTVEIQYHYEPTVTEAMEITGDAPHGGHPGNAVGQASYVVVGDVATSYYDSSVDWSGVLHPKLGPDGMLTTKGNGTELKNVTVENTPSTEQGFLVVKIHAY